MNSCRECQQKTPERRCEDCPDFLSRGPLSQKPLRPVSLTLEGQDGKMYPAELLILNTVEMGLETNAPLRQHYQVKLLENLTLELAPVPTKGKGQVHVFDILSVHRGNEAGEHLNKEEYDLLSSRASDLVKDLTAHLPSSLQDLARAKLLAEIEKSEIINALEVGRVMKYEYGRLRDLAGKPDLPLPVEEAQKLMEEVVRRADHRREVIISADGRHVFDLHGIPFDYRSGGLLALDITDIIEKERRMHRQQMEAYREAILAVTGGRLQLTTLEEIEKLTGHGTWLAGGEVKQAADIVQARAQVAEVLANTFPSARRYGILLSLSEALTNVIKHAAGGKWTAWQTDKGLRLAVEDTGPGIKLTELPRATLMQHYSTKKSLGSGFTLMLYYSDRIYLATGREGTRLVLEFAPGAKEEKIVC